MSTIFKVVVDSGASEHVVHDIHLLKEAENGPEINVELANRNAVRVTDTVIARVNVWSSQTVQRKAYLIPSYI